MTTALGGLPSEQDAKERDAADPLSALRARFHIPPGRPDGHAEAAYFAGNSLGLQPRTVRADLGAELDRWSVDAVHGHHTAGGWLDQVSAAVPAMASIVGAEAAEVAVMNTLTVNLHLLMATFYRPSGDRVRIVIEDHAFPSDSHAVRSQAEWHGLDPDQTVVRLRPRAGESALRTDDVVAFLQREGDSVALLLLGGVNYLSGEVMDIPAITTAGHAAGAVVGWDLAHAAGNIELALHEWDVDFAAWCTYKYLNAGPGATSAIFVHRRHFDGPGEPLPRLAGWWGTSVDERFEMAPVFAPAHGAAGWALSTTPVLSSVPVRVAAALHAEIGMPTLRARSIALTTYLYDALTQLAATAPIGVLTPAAPERRGAQISVQLLPDAPGDAAKTAQALWERHGVVADDRRPDIIRFAPAPLYSSYHDCWRAVTALAEVTLTP